MNDYVQAFEADRAHAASYLSKSIHQKTEQQKRLEELIRPLALNPEHIADIACGAGSLSYHLSKLYPSAHFTLADLGEQALAIAMDTATRFRSTVLQADACALPLPSGRYDLVFFWQTLLAVTEPKRALEELVRICRSGGRVFLSSLFNVDSDVDLYIGAVDHTRGSAQAGIRHPYNVYSAQTIKRWCQHPMTFHDFDIATDIPKNGRGLGTHTVTAGAKRLQFSAGIYMNWKILEIHKV